MKPPEPEWGLMLNTLRTALLVTAGTMSMAIRERVGEVAVLKALGFESWHIFGLMLAELGVEDWQTVLEAMYPMDEYEDVVDRTELLAVNRENALNAPPPPPPVQPGSPGTEGPAGAAPHPPAPRKPRPRRIHADSNANESATLERAVKALLKASEALKAKRN